MRVLFVDDDEVVAQSVEMALRENGHDCDITDLGERAIAMSKRHGYDIIVLDVGLPDIDGDQVARRMKMEGVDTPLLLQSGIDDPSLAAEAKSLGIDDFLAKPFSIKDLIGRMEAILGISDPLSETPPAEPAKPKRKAQRSTGGEGSAPTGDTPWEPWAAGQDGAKAATGALPAAPPRPSAVAQARAAMRARPAPPSRLQAASETMAEGGAKAFGEPMAKVRAALDAKPLSGAAGKARAALRARLPSRAKATDPASGAPSSDADSAADSGKKAGASLAARARTALDANPLSKAVAKARTTFGEKSAARAAKRPGSEPRLESGIEVETELPAAEPDDKLWGAPVENDPTRPEPESGPQDADATTEPIIELGPAQPDEQQAPLELAPHFFGGAESVAADEPEQAAEQEEGETSPEPEPEPEIEPQPELAAQTQAEPEAAPYDEQQNPPELEAVALAEPEQATDQEPGEALPEPGPEIEPEPELAAQAPVEPGGRVPGLAEAEEPMWSWTDASRAQSDAAPRSEPEPAAVEPQASPAETPDKDGAKRRRHKRREIVEAAVIESDDSEIPCVILDGSTGGAALMLCDPEQDCPESFVLVTLQGAEHRCEQRWRDGDTLGVEFV